MVKTVDIQTQRNEWKKKSWSIPELKGGKENYFELVTDLIDLIGNNQANDLNTIPNIPSLSNLRSWQTYIPFLKGMGLVINHSGTIVLSDLGESFRSDPTKLNLANIMQDRIRLFAEVLDLINKKPLTVQDID